MTAGPAESIIHSPGPQEAWKKGGEGPTTRLYATHPLPFLTWSAGTLDLCRSVPALATDCSRALPPRPLRTHRIHAARSYLLHPLHLHSDHNQPNARCTPGPSPGKEHPLVQQQQPAAAASSQQQPAVVVALVRSGTCLPTVVCRLPPWLPTK
jgi:hypothetical protein